ncbi:hypothetical protein H9Q08_05640 [Chryseobacterium sp. PS-8]|uniref:DUF551 domain-containing protein n=1 Tax=Chryseobacterium indicum TaxID=2766954 RepID=A0ABS9C4C1_9FLAO|nr:hypothetical protein [Chryseobacterium sp. PS-8]MCF2218780.1 hypothetical protein [Chryseobacterium sp. PS-8]
MFKIFKRYKENRQNESQNPLENCEEERHKAINLFDDIIQLPSNFRTDIFYPMNMLPPRTNNEPFSVLVIVYDKDDSSYFNIGYYNYDIDKWEIFADEIMNLKCWCFAPNPNKYWNDQKFITVQCKH